MLMHKSVIDVPVDVNFPDTQTKLVSANFPKYVHYGNGVHSHKRHHHGHDYAHIHQHAGGDVEHSHSARFWRQQERLDEERMSFLSF